MQVWGQEKTAPHALRLGSGQGDNKPAPQGVSYPPGGFAHMALMPLGQGCYPHLRAVSFGCGGFGAFTMTGQVHGVDPESPGCHRIQKALPLLPRARETVKEDHGSPLTADLKGQVSPAPGDLSAGGCLG